MIKMDDEHKEIVKDELLYFKKYYYDHPEFREKHLARMKEKISCECGCVVSRSNLSKHQKSKKHFRKMVEKIGDQELKKQIDNLDITYKMGLEDVKKKYFQKMNI